MHSLFLVAGATALMASGVLAKIDPDAATPATNPLLADWTGPAGGVPPWNRADAYRAFRGRDPDVNALLQKRGFPTMAAK